MHKNEAISRVAERAMEQIFDIAQYAIAKIADEDLGNFEPMAQTSFTEVIARAEQAQAATLDALSANPEKPARKPRTPKAQPQEVLEPTPASENDFEDSSKKIEIVLEDVEVLEASPPIEGTTAVLEADEDTYSEEFPNYSDDWFHEDVERGRALCRKLLSKMVSKIGDKATREAIFETTKKPRATDFDAADCMNFYRANHQHGG